MAWICKDSHVQTWPFAADRNWLPARILAHDHVAHRCNSSLILTDHVHACMKTSKTQVRHPQGARRRKSWES